MKNLSKLFGIGALVATLAGCSSDKPKSVDEPLLMTGMVKDERWTVTKDGYRGAHRFDLDLGTVVYGIDVDEPMKNSRPIYGNGAVVCVPISSKLIEEGNNEAARIVKMASPPYPAYMHTNVKSSDIKMIARLSSK